jgi:hypothetical protein
MGQQDQATPLESSTEQQLGRFGFSSTSKLHALLSEAVQHPHASQVRPQQLQAPSYQQCVQTTCHACLFNCPASTVCSHL